MTANNIIIYKYLYLLDLLHKSKNDQFIGRFLYQTIRHFRLLLFHELLKSKNTVKQPV